MKTVRILLYPSDEQLLIMEEITKIYGDFMLHNIILQNRAIESDEVPDSLCFSSSVQLCRDIRRRIGRTKKTVPTFPHPYCRWGDDYRLSETEVILPLGKGFQTNELKIDCIYRPFQTKLLRDKHPPTLVLKHMHNHWFAYLLVEGDI